MEHTYLFADLPVRVTHRHAYLAEQCADYGTDRAPLFSVDLTEQSVAHERAVSRETSGDAEYPDGYLEFLAFYRKFCTIAPHYGVILLHGAVVEADGGAYLFAAPSGVGKTTHVRLWQKLLGARMRVINGDKPLVRVEKDGVTVYGTPWNGKEGMGENASARLRGICFVRRGVENAIEPLSAQDALSLLLRQLYRPDDAESDALSLSLAMDLLDATPCWRLACNMSDEAAKLSIQTMLGETL